MMDALCPHEIDGISMIVSMWFILPCNLLFCVRVLCQDHESFPPLMSIVLLLLLDKCTWSWSKSNITGKESSQGFGGYVWLGDVRVSPKRKCERKAAPPPYFHILRSFYSNWQWITLVELLLSSQTFSWNAESQFHHLIIRVAVSIFIFVSFGCDHLDTGTGALGGGKQHEVDRLC